jgi:hypothetical protein
MDWIQFLIGLGIICIVIAVVVKVIPAMGIPIHPVVWIIGAGILGIILLIWMGKLLPALL